MVIHHVSGGIVGLLGLTNKKLSLMFGGDGKEIRKHLKALQKKGDLLIPSENCTHFNPKNGCECYKFNQDGTANQRSPFGL